jgi:hypothetical protein
MPYTVFIGDLGYCLIGGAEQDGNRATVPGDRDLARAGCERAESARGRSRPDGGGMPWLTGLLRGRPAVMAAGTVARTSQAAARLSVPALEVAVELAHGHRDCRNPGGSASSSSMKIPQSMIRALPGPMPCRMDGFTHGSAPRQLSGAGGIR